MSLLIIVYFFKTVKHCRKASMQNKDIIFISGNIIVKKFTPIIFEGWGLGVELIYFTPYWFFAKFFCVVLTMAVVILIMLFIS